MTSPPSRNGHVFPRFFLLVFLAVVVVLAQTLVRRQTPQYKDGLAIDEVVQEQNDDELEDFWKEEKQLPTKNGGTNPSLTYKPPTNPMGRKKHRWKDHITTTNNANDFYSNCTCLTQGAPDVPNDWHVRAPGFVLLGAMKGGTTALSFYLRQHPKIVTPLHAETHFFDLHFDIYATADGILRKNARNAYSNFLRHESIGDGDIWKDPSLYALDNSPRYLFWSTVVASRLLCVAPWVKLLMVLRNPVDRAFSHFNMQVNTRLGKTLPPSFEEWIEMDLQRMRQSGLISDNGHDDTFAGSQQERDAWKVYTGEGSNEIYKTAVLGKSMYAIQLQHWYEAMDEIGKPQSDLLVLRSEELKEDTAKVVGRILDFLALPSFKLNNTDERHTGKYKTALKNETRQMLQEFFEPYNKRLYEMLGLEWDGVWET